MLNREVKIVELFENASCILVKEFGDIEGMVEIMRKLFSSREKYIYACLEAHKLYDKFYRWEITHESTKKKFLNDNGL